MSDLLPKDASTDLREYLLGLTLHGIKLGLQNIRFLMEQAGNPQAAYPTAHVAGTNGKGSVVAMLQAMLRASGCRVGRFTSPHIIDLPERFQIDGVCIAEDALSENTAFFRRCAAGMEPPPTFFELNSAIAFRWFAQERVDAAVIEVGMGGRLDSTNIITPLACAITNIDLEHTQYLGGTLEEIAFEKAGTLKPGVPAATGERREGPLNIIRARARELAAPLRVLGEDFSYMLSGPVWRQSFSYRSESLALKEVPLGLAGRYQGENAAIAVAVAEQLRPHFPGLTDAAIARGLSEARWPCRLERILETPPVIIDVAHNVAGARRLAENIGRCVVVLAVASDKDAAGMIEALAPLSGSLILTEFNGKRALPLETLCSAAQGRPHAALPDLPAAIARGIELASQEMPLLITGSIYTAGEARQILTDRYGALPLAF